MALAALFLSASAHATLIGDTVNISLVSPNEPTPVPGPINLSDSVAVTANREIVPNNNNPATDTNVGSYLLSNEFVDVQGDRILLRLESGGTDNSGNLVTGYAAGAYYEIGDLDFFGGSITGYDVFLTGITDPNGNSVQFLNGDTFRIFIAALLITDIPTTGFDTGDIEIRLRTSGTPPPPPMPEPGTLALLGLGLAGLALQRSRKSS